ncbi:MAG: hypothetical protein JW727_02680 [Candidatus Aenigmarchaeota archaeon]|nr:hypothetical protein [Candidatus Aenigmarchaeota archaeon]
MRGQTFVLGAISLALSFLLLMPAVQKDLYLPTLGEESLQNVAGSYNSWIAYQSLEGIGETSSFGRFVKGEYPHLEIFYVLADGKTLSLANFFDSTRSVSLEGGEVLLDSGEVKRFSCGKSVSMTFEGRNISYEPQSALSGAIFISGGLEGARLEILRIYK